MVTSSRSACVLFIQGRGPIYLARTETTFRNEKKKKTSPSCLRQDPRGKDDVGRDERMRLNESILTRDIGRAVYGGQGIEIVRDL